MHAKGEAHHAVQNDRLEYPDRGGGQITGQGHTEGEDLGGNGASLQGPQNHPQHQRPEKQGECNEEGRHTGAEVGRGVLVRGLQVYGAADGVGDGVLLLIAPGGHLFGTIGQLGGQFGRTGA
ncbi:Uncharacterised protein [Mycobacteroides abscessus subsp. massiliense]|nr:Uncharacterised protein [Mycobacteroides abscessus subsp. massiliense]